MKKHIVIDVPADIWPNMNAEYERLNDSRYTTHIALLGRPLVKTRIGDDGHLQLVSVFL